MTHERIETLESAARNLPKIWKKIEHVPETTPHVNYGEKLFTRTSVQMVEVEYNIL